MTTEDKFSPVAVQLGQEQMYLVIVDDVPFGYIPLSKGSHVFNTLLCDRKSQLEQNLGHTLSENVRMDDKGDCVVTLESPTRSMVWGGMRQRSKLELKKVNIISTVSKEVSSPSSTSIAYPTNS